MAANSLTGSLSKSSHLVDIKISLNGEESRLGVLDNSSTSTSGDSNSVGKKKTLNSPIINGYPLYFDGESVSGRVQLRVKEGKKLDHSGIKVEFVGQIVLFNDQKSSLDFIQMQRELAVAGELRHSHSFDFEFRNVEKQFESYHGRNCSLRYLIRVIIGKRLGNSGGAGSSGTLSSLSTGTIVEEKEIWVYTYKIPPEVNESIKMEVGIEDCLHLEFEYSKSKYSLDDVIVGRIYFLLVRIKIRVMELSIVRRESVGATQHHNENETVVKYEIMDGAPVRGESIPIRLFLSNIATLTPTFRDVNKRFSVRYYLNLVLIDEENRRYFKQQEITLFRVQSVDEKPLPPSPTILSSSQADD